MPTYPQNVSNGQLLQKLLESSPTATIMLNTTQEVVFWNKAAEALWNIPSQEALGQALSAILPTLAHQIPSTFNPNFELSTSDTNSNSEKLLRCSLSKIEQGEDVYSLLNIIPQSNSRRDLQDAVNAFLAI